MPLWAPPRAVWSPSPAAPPNAGDAGARARPTRRPALPRRAEGRREGDSSPCHPEATEQEQMRAGVRTQVHRRLRVTYAAETRQVCRWRRAACRVRGHRGGAWGALGSRALEGLPSPPLSPFLPLRLRRLGVPPLELAQEGSSRPLLPLGCVPPNSCPSRLFPDQCLPSPVPAPITSQTPAPGDVLGKPLSVREIPEQGQPMCLASSQHHRLPVTSRPKAPTAAAVSFRPRGQVLSGVPQPSRAQTHAGGLGPGLNVVLFHCVCFVATSARDADAGFLRGRDSFSDNKWT